MGTTGRNTVLWLMILDFTALIIAVLFDRRAAGQVFFFLAAALAFGWFKYTFHDMPRARKNSIKLGLEVIDLLPVNVMWAKLLTGKKIAVQATRAYEIHLRLQTVAPRQLIEGMEKDLAFIEKNMQGLFLWETKVAVPRRIRKIIKNYEERGEAFWERGSWPVPGPSFTGSFTGKRLGKCKKPTRRGAIIIGIGGVGSEQKSSHFNLFNFGAGFYSRDRLDYQQGAPKGHRNGKRSANHPFHSCRRCN